jgi:hypothetical protein
MSYDFILHSEQFDICRFWTIFDSPKNEKQEHQTLNNDNKKREKLNDTKDRR